MNAVCNYPTRIETKNALAIQINDTYHLGYFQDKHLRCLNHLSTAKSDSNSNAKSETFNV